MYKVETELHAFYKDKNYVKILTGCLTYNAFKDSISEKKLRKLRLKGFDSFKHDYPGMKSSLTMQAFSNYIKKTTASYVKVGAKIKLSCVMSSKNA